MRRVVICVCSTLMLLNVLSSAFAADDVVAYTSDVTAAAGTWTRASDASAAGGQKMADVDRGWSSTTAPLASPADFFEVAVNAAANTPYHVWVRMRAAADSKWNDSVWLQFDDASSTAGGPVYGTGTTSGLLLNLEPCNNCGTAGWGWVDGAYWLNQVNVVQFATSGTHTLRIQTREDGAQIDQVVLSPTNYITRSPGDGLNDATIVSKAAAAPAAAVTPAAVTATPYLGTAVILPGSINAPDFDNGGDGIGYHDSTGGNSGGVYRTGDVDLEPSAGGGYDVGWIAAGEWLNYTVNVAAAGNYTVQLRVASPTGGASLHVGFNKSGVWTIASVPNTGAWQNWTTVNVPVMLVAGQQQLTLLFDASGLNISRITVVAAGGGSVAAPTPYTGSPLAIPGTLEAEQFDNGGEGVGYHDTTPGNSGGALRSTDVDLQPASSGGYNVGWVMPGEWLKYTVNVASAGTYTAQFRVASPTQGGTFHLEMNGTNVTGSLNVPNTGDWQNWQTVTATVQLAAGQQAARLVIDSGGAAGVGNFDRMQLTAGGTTSPAPSAGGATISVAPGQDLQAAINAAKPGDTILLTPGAVYQGGLSLPVKSGSDYITIRSGAADASLPPQGGRITPSYAGQLPKIQGGTAGLPAIMTELGAHHWRLQFLELVDTWPYGDILQLGDGSYAQTSLSTVAHDLIVDRVYIHGVTGQEQKRGIALNSASTTITGSYISDIRLTNGDSQAIAGWNGPGPFTITNNYLEATGENFLLGGSDPPIQGLVPSDIVFRGNTVSKQPSWRSGGYAVKNLIEFKNAQRVTIDGNIIEYNWSGGQSGHAIVLTPRNQDGAAPWSVVRQIQITNNVIRHVAGVLNILGTDYRFPSQPLTDVVFRNNLVLDLSGANWGGAGQLLLTSGGNNVTLDHNTVFMDGTSVVYADGNPVSGFTFTNNIVPDNMWAVMGAGVSEGNGTLSAFFPGSAFERNVIVGGQSSLYPSGNYFPSTVSLVGFQDLAGNYRLLQSSPYITAGTDGAAIGANIGAVVSATGTTY
jgi:hypothetical protein